MKKNLGKILIIAGVISVMSSSAVFADTTGIVNITSDVSGQTGNYGGAASSYDGLVTDQNGNMVMPTNRESKLNVSDGVNFTNNNASTGGGAISIQNGQTAEIGNGVIFNQNESYCGGAIYTATNDAVLGNDVEFNGNTASLGGAIYNGSSDFDSSNMTIGTGAKFQGNSAQYGGGIYNLSYNDESKIEIGSGALFDSNNASVSGGAIYNEDTNKSEIYINGNTTFSNNTAGTSGGALHNGSKLSINTTAGDVKFSGNTADGSKNDIHQLSTGTTSITGTNKVSMDGGFSGEGVINKTGTGTLEFTNADNSNYTGAFNQNGGSLILNNTDLFKNGNVTIQNTNLTLTGTYGTIASDNIGKLSNSTIKNTILNVTDTTISTTEKLTLTAGGIKSALIKDTSYTGDITVNNGTSLSINSIDKDSTYTGNLTNNGTVNILAEKTTTIIDSTLSGNGAINQNGTLNVTDTDTSAYNGKFTQNDGTVTFTNSNLFANSELKDGTTNLEGTANFNENSNITANGTLNVNNDASLKNSSVKGSGIFDAKKTLTLDKSTIAQNKFTAASDLTASNNSSISSVEDTNVNGKLTLSSSSFTSNGNAALKDVELSSSSTLSAKDISADSLKSDSSNITANGDLTVTNDITAENGSNINAGSVAASNATVKGSSLTSAGAVQLTGDINAEKSEVKAGSINAVNAVLTDSSLHANGSAELTGNLTATNTAISSTSIKALETALTSATLTTGNAEFTNLTTSNNTSISAKNILADNITTEATNINVSGNATVSGDMITDTTNIVINGTTTVSGKTELNNNSILSMNGNAKFEDLKVGNGSVLQFLNPESTFEATNGFTVANGTINVMNGVLTNNVIESNMTVDEKASFVVDVDPRNFQSDIFTINGDIINANPDVPAQITISDFNLTSVPVNRYIELPELFYLNGSVDETVNFMDSEVQKFTPIGWYQMQRSLTGEGYRLGLTAYNPQVFRGQVATVASYANQLAANSILLDHVYLTSQSLMAKERSNKYAASYPQFAPYQYNKDTGSLWVKSYVNFETIGMTNHLNVGNNAYGTFIGADFPVVQMKDGWKFLPTAFIGYNGAHQTFDQVGMYQNGGQAGFMGTFMKNDFIGSALIYGGGYNNEMNITNTTTFGSESSYRDKTGNWFAGVAAKAAYNLHATEHFIVQPTLLASYNLFGQQNWHTNYGDMSMRSNYLNGVNVAPGVNFIYARETWSLYLTAQYVYNIMGYAGGMAGRDVELPHVRMRHGYLEYGVGATKTIKDRLHSYFQIIVRNGGRTGVGFQLGFSWLF